MTWRTDPSNPRLIRTQVGPAPASDDPMIGVMDTAELAAQVVAAVNGGTPAQDGPTEVIVSTLQRLSDALTQAGSVNEDGTVSLPPDALRDALAGVRIDAARPTVLGPR